MTRTIIQLRRSRDATEPSRLIVLVQPKSAQPEVPSVDDREATTPDSSRPAPPGAPSTDELAWDDDTPLFVAANDGAVADATGVDATFAPGAAQESTTAIDDAVDADAVDAVTVDAVADSDFATVAEACWSEEAILAVEGTCLPSEECAVV